MIITFMGNDGSGKTTTAKEIFSMFKDLGFSVYYKHEYEYVLLRYLFKIIGKQNLAKSRNEMLVERKISRRFRIWPLLVWTDLLVQYFYFKLARRNDIIILDRYPYDHLMSFKYLGTLTKFSEWLFSQFPKPDISMVLVVDPQTAFERKKDTHSYSIEFYESQTKEYVSLANRLNISIIDTSRDFTDSFVSVIIKLLENRRLSKKIIRNGVQNRTIMHVIEKYNLSRIEKLEGLINRHNQRKALFVKSLSTLKKILADFDIDKYALIKTIDDFDFIGNDIDVIISPENLTKLRQNLLSSKVLYDIREVNYDEGKDKGKLEIIIDQGLKLDIHSYVGWQNVIFITFEEIAGFIKQNKVHSLECKTIEEEVDSLIIAAQIFEKGHITLDECLFLRRYFDKDSLSRKFPKLTKALDNHITRLQKILEGSDHFPAFLPLTSFLKDYPNVLNDQCDSSKKLSLFRDTLIMIFWKVRFLLKQKLPFELDYYRV